MSRPNDALSSRACPSPQGQETKEVNGEMSRGNQATSKRELPTFSGQGRSRHVSRFFAEDTVAKFGVTRGTSVPAVVDLKFHLLDKDEPDTDNTFR